MWEAYIIFSAVLLVVSFLPRFKNQHWLFRVWDFGKTQLTIIMLATFLAGFLLNNFSTSFYIIQGFLLITIAYHCIVLAKYTPLYPRSKHQKSRNSSKNIKIISANIYLFNKDYASFISLIKKNEPDLFLMMESDEHWENAVKILEKDYPNHIKVSLDNTYGMHFYSKFKVAKSKVHYFVADDIPSIEAHLETEDGFKFVFFGVHPPPPSPTEEETSKERDGDILSVAKEVKNIEKPVLVIGDFNNVAWSNSSILFKKVSELIDPRIGRGFISTYHAKYKLLRFPIDLMFHSPDIFIENLKTLEAFGSDHLPILCEFYIDKNDQKQKNEVEKSDTEEKTEAEELIDEGKKAESDR
ncbi:endonuclease/exonuclease/phosphatase family protein [Frigoriflavimonas asaccharolytica]|uniref:Endonuclease/exonuclease/phosphatase (EEP) superfamily protein YafD n=1 Tax=Frigoriflavimonas asaccharolytica TaxID=2735899 RepID=A0A8J8K7G5_9FLAO|nr:endonuclease/exonuclease/phosphatase family protein [Frigoriflavimonas asaccharolytica]NRS91983.1 endonuclease/exonuclease/phosphatase (EEP) superfamily protein YafD [Frigoriflavimonas asaccharolytica]